MPHDKALFFADSHEGGGWESHPNVRGDDAFALMQIAAAAGRHAVAHVVGLGDLIDRQVNRSRVATFFRFIDSLKKGGHKFWYLQGQHDYDDPPWASCHGYALHLHRQVVEFGAVVLYGIDYQPLGRLQEELDEVPDYANTLACHQGWGDWMGEVTSPQGDFAQVPGHVLRVITGDLHQFRLETAKNCDGGKMVVCSPGATFAQAINEPHQHYYVVVSGDGVCKRHRLKSRPFIDWPVMNRPEDLDRFASDVEEELARAAQKAAADELPDEVATPLMRVTYSHRLQDAARRVRKLVGGRAHLFWKELPPEEKAATLAVRKDKGVVGEAATPLSVLSEVVDRDKDPELYDLVARLLTASDRKQAFAEWRASYLQEG